MTENEPNDYEERADWYGRKAKRKRDFSGRRAVVAPFAFGFLVALVMLLCGGLALFTSQSFGRPLAAKPTETASPAPTDTPTATVTATRTPTRSPTSTPFPTFTPSANGADRVFISLAGGKNLRPLGVKPSAGYSFRGLRVDGLGRLHIAHTRGFDKDNTPVCNPNEAYWVLEPGLGNVADKIADQTMVAPKSIAFDSRRNSYVIGIDCVHGVAAVFKFDSKFKLIDTFTVVGADDLLVLDDDRILVAINGFVCTAESGEQQHLIVLLSDPETGKLKQIAQGGPDECAATYHSMITGTNEVLLLKSAPNKPDTLIHLGVAKSIEDTTPDAYRSVGYRILDDVGEPLVELALTKDKMLVGVGATTGSIFYFLDNGTTTTKGISIGIRPRSFVIDLRSTAWCFVGQVEQ